MKFRAVIKKTDNWWIGWLVDLPGVNAQEKTKEELLESLRIGAEDMLRMALEAPSEKKIVEIVKAKVTKEGLTIPGRFFKGFGDIVNIIRRSQDIVIKPISSSGNRLHKHLCLPTGSLKHLACGPDEEGDFDGQDID